MTIKFSGTSFHADDSLARVDVNLVGHPKEMRRSTWILCNNQALQLAAKNEIISKPRYTRGSHIA
jgi:hypothetical protein